MTSWPVAERALKNVGYGLTGVAVVCALFWRFAISLWLCLAASALLLVRLNLSERWPRDQRTALADLVLLTPLLAFLFLLR